MENKDGIDFLALGDVVTEPFIRIKDAAVHCKLNEEECELCFRFGDKVPYESAEICHAVGNSANAAVSASRLGIKTAFMGYVGNDSIGKDILETLKKDGVDTRYMVTADGYPSNYHYVLWYDVERTILVHHTEFPYSFPEDLPPPKWLYLSSLASNSTDYHKQIGAYLKKHPEINVAFNPGTFQMKLGVETLKEIYEETTLFSVNVEEAQRILKSEEHNPRKLIDALRALGPKMILLTDGIKGAYGFDGNQYFFMPIYPHKPYERTGAGDAFTSTFAAALCRGKSFEEAFLWAPINAMSVTQHVGAQKGLLREEELTAYLEKAPVDYKPVQLL